MEFERNLLEILSIIIIITFLQRKTNISENDLLTLILINIFIFVVYDYLSLNKSCPKTESFTNNEPCNIKDIENMFNRFISKKKENFSKVVESSKSTEVSPEDDLADLIASKINNQQSNIEDEEPDSKQIIDIVDSDIVKDLEDQETIKSVTEIDDIITEYEAEKQKAVKSSMCAKSDWSDIANTYVDNSASYPNIFNDSTTLSYPNYDNEEVPCTKINKQTSLPNNHTNDINALKKETNKEKELKNKLWSCQRRLKKCS